MRLMVFFGLILTILLVVIGLTIAIWDVYFTVNPGDRSNYGIPLVSLGVGIYTGGSISKAWQSQAENRGSGA
jgi:O-antigen/teichoic acid export membrane protein